MSLNLRLSHAKNELVARECQIKELTKETIELKRENSELHGRQVFRGGGQTGRSGSSNKVGSGRNKGKMAPKDRKDLKGGTQKPKEIRGGSWKWREREEGDPPVPPPLISDLFKVHADPN